MSIKRTVTAFAAVLTLVGGMATAAIAAGDANKKDGEHGADHTFHPKHVERQSWSFSGLLGRYDSKQLKRGFQIYNEVCATCHGMGLLSYRNLMEKGGPEFTKKQVEGIIADKEVPAGPNDDGDTHVDGELLMRKALLTDRFVEPYANDKAAMAANGGALPPDLSVMAKARGIPHHDTGATSGDPFTATIGGLYQYGKWVFGVVYDVATQYQEGGPDYIYALMTSYHDEAPAGIDVGDKSFNEVFPGYAISMPSQIMDDLVEYSDGTKATADQHARDISAFLMWTAEPHLNARKNLGLKVLIYLLILSVLMFIVKRTIWSGVKH